MTSNIVQRALLLPEILANIFSELEKEKEDAQWCRYPSQGRTVNAGHLLQCGLVNKFWYREAMPFLWAIPCQYYNPRKFLAKLLAGIEPDRRQSCAKYIKGGIIKTYNWGAAEDDEIFHGLDFPNMKKLVLICDGRHTPQFVSQGVTSLTIISDDSQQPEVMATILDKIPVGLIISWH